MNLTITPLQPDIEKILRNDKATIIKTHMSAIIHSKRPDYTQAIIISKDVIRDYGQAAGDYINLVLRIPAGDYLKYIQPEHHNLEITLITTPINLVDHAVSKTFKPVFIRYKAILSMDKNPQYNLGDIGLTNRENLNQGNLLDVQFQLMEKSFEALRGRTVQGIYRDETPESVLKSIHTTALTNSRMEGKTASLHLQVAPLDNETIRKHIIIPTDTLLTRVPELISRQFGGIYNGFVGTFFQRYKNVPTWFIYPLYNKTLYKKEKRKIIFYQAPGDRLDLVEKTYRVDQDVIHALTASGLNITDLKAIRFTSTGPGFVMADSQKVYNDGHEDTVEGPRVQKDQMTIRLKNQNIEDGNNYLRRDPMGPHMNLYSEVAEMMKKNALIVDVTWPYSHSDLIYPGLPCGYKTIKSGKVYSLVGTILFVQSTVQKLSGDLREHSFSESTVIRMAIYPEDA